MLSCLPVVSIAFNPPVENMVASQDYEEDDLRRDRERQIVEEGR